MLDGNLHAMPTMIDYDDALLAMTARGFRCVYPRGGAFVPTRPGQVEGWLIAADPTLRPAARDLARIVSPPTTSTLCAMLKSHCHDKQLGEAWLMPKAHWAHELDAGKNWLVPLLGEIEIDTNLLEARADASPIVFAPTEHDLLARITEQLLNHLEASDFLLAFEPCVCTVHHHKQLWWQWLEGPRQQLA